MRLRKGINVVMVPDVETAKEYGFNEETYLDEINKRLFGKRPAHFIQSLDITNPDIRDFAEYHKHCNTIVYTYFDDLSDLFNENFTNLQSATLRFLLDNIVILFVTNKDYEPEEFLKVKDKIFHTNKYYDFLGDFMAIEYERYKHYSPVKIRMHKYTIFNKTKAGIVRTPEWIIRSQQSANFNDIYPINKYYCQTYIETEKDSFEIEQFIQACTEEDANNIFVDYLINIHCIDKKDICKDRLYIQEISTEMILTRSKLEDLIEKQLQEKEKKDGV